MNYSAAFSTVSNMGDRDFLAMSRKNREKTQSSLHPKQNYILSLSRHVDGQ
jgi:hypothetical protein